MSAFKHIRCRVRGKFFSEVILDLSNCKTCLVNNLPLSDRHLKSILHAILALFAFSKLLMQKNLPDTQLKGCNKREINNSDIMTVTKLNNRLVTPELREALSDYPLYSQDAKGKDALCIAVFHLGNIRWYIMEGQPEGDDFTLYGIVVGLHETEYGYMSASEMADVTYDASKYGLGLLKIEQDRSFKSCALREVKDKELQSFLSRLYDEN
ncbi:hypothetical protein K210099B7_19170 [Bacteroides xylanisolvens]|jgi:conserved domain protein